MNDPVLQIFMVGCGVFGIALAAAVFAVIAPDNPRTEPDPLAK